MKTMKKTIGCALSGGVLICRLLMGQNEPERATVPLHDPSRPAQIRADLLNGGITVRGYDGKEVIVDARVRENREREKGEHTPPRAAGMRRLTLPGNAGLEVQEEDNIVRVKSSSFNTPVDLVISTPRRSSLTLKCVNDGDIEVENVDGELDVNNLNGKITLKNVSGSVLAHSLNGEVVVGLNRVDGSKPMSFSTMNGDIDVTLPPDVRGNVRLKSDNGEVYSDYDLKLSNSASLEKGSGQQKDGTYHLKFDRKLKGSINGGGPEYQFTTFNGDIYIRKRK